MDIHTSNKIAAIHRAVREIADTVDVDRFSVRQLLVLLSVGAKGRPVGQQELVNEANTHNSTISKTVSMLAGSQGTVRHHGLGLLKVELSDADLRSRDITLSSDGEKLLARAAKKAFPAG